jgi:hypothetical protein
MSHTIDVLFRWAMPAAKTRLISETERKEKALFQSPTEAMCRVRIGGIGYGECHSVRKIILFRTDDLSEIVDTRIG